MATISGARPRSSLRSATPIASATARVRRAREAGVERRPDARIFGVGALGVEADRRHAQPVEGEGVDENRASPGDRVAAELGGSEKTRHHQADDEIAERVRREREPDEHGRWRLAPTREAQGPTRLGLAR